MYIAKCTIHIRVIIIITRSSFGRFARKSSPLNTRTHSLHVVTNNETNLVLILTECISINLNIAVDCSSIITRSNAWKASNGTIFEEQEIKKNSSDTPQHDDNNLHKEYVSSFPTERYSTKLSKSKCMWITIEYIKNSLLEWILEETWPFGV